MLVCRDLESLAELRSCLDELEALCTARKKSTGMYVSKPIFRGHASSEWKLQTTLERAAGPTSAKKYHGMVFAAKPQIEAHTDQTFQVLIPPDFANWIDSQSAFGLFDFPGYEYLVYLRHHGFPSPLLDWSASAYVATFFAFRNVVPSADKAAIYAYVEYMGTSKGGWTGDPHIRGRGPYVKTHRRHFWQQAQYTICVRREGLDWHYAPHDDAVKLVDASLDDDEVLWKLTLPTTARMEILRELDRYNLNAFSLFGSEDALAETVAFRELGAADSDP